MSKPHSVSLRGVSGLRDGVKVGRVRVFRGNSFSVS